MSYEKPCARHREPSDLADRFALGVTKLLRFLADTLFAKRYGHRAIVLETVAAVPARHGQQWLEHARSICWRLAAGALSTAQRRRQRVAAWLAALRLQFYPMTWIAYTVGALAAVVGAPLAMVPYLLGYLVLFLLEAATVFLNDWFDFDSDRINRLGGPFTGGSRVLVDGRLDHAAMREGKTTHQILLEQLELLDGKMREIAADLHRRDSEQLLIHGRFLEDKFRDGGAWLADR